MMGDSTTRAYICDGVVHVQHFDTLYVKRGLILDRYLRYADAPGGLRWIGSSLIAELPAHLRKAVMVEALALHTQRVAAIRARRAHVDG